MRGRALERAISAETDAGNRPVRYHRHMRTRSPTIDRETPVRDHRTATFSGKVIFCHPGRINYFNSIGGKGKRRCRNNLSGFQDEWLTQKCHPYIHEKGFVKKRKVAH